MKEEVLSQKQAVIDEIKENIEKSEAMVLVDYRGLDVSELTELRNKYREENVVYKVYKNTMMNFAFKDLGYDDFLDLLNGPNAVAFSMDDPMAAARVSKNFASDHENLVIKAGYLGDKFLDVDGVKKIAAIPPKDQLIAKLLGSLRAPLSNFVYVTKAIADKKAEEGEGAQASETTEAEPSENAEGQAE
ncbi:MAG: 50S ribosomal protein L10 [Finegoldia sp.]|nr:50S ribosomal protein L10 [Finegoldia sp.]